MSTPSPISYRNNNKTSASHLNNNISGGLPVSNTKGHKPSNPTAHPLPKWSVAQTVERSSSSQDTSSSSETSPKNPVRSHQAAGGSQMHESSSGHSLSSSNQAWAYTPSHSDSNSSLSSLTKPQVRDRPVRSDSSGSLGSAQLSRLPHTPSGSTSSVNSGNNINNNVASSGGISGGIPDNFVSLTHARPFMSHPNPSAFQNRLNSRSEGQIHTPSSLHGGKPTPPSFLPASKYAVVHPPVPVPPASPRTEHRDSGGSNSSLSAQTAALRNLDLNYMKRASTESTLSQPDGSLSPTGSGPPFPLPRDDSSQSVSSLGSSSNRRLSPQSAVHMGISSVQRKLQEQERTKQEYEQDVHVLKNQLLDAQERLQHAELRLLDHESETHLLMDEWRCRLSESEEKMRRQQEEKDLQMKTIIGRLQTIEEELKREHAEMSSAVEHKQQVIEVQEQRIRTLDQANGKLLQALQELKGRALAEAEESQREEERRERRDRTNGQNDQKDLAGFKTSSC